jgi:outer membrane immunogenic protein
MSDIKHHVIAGVLALGFCHGAQAADPRIWAPTDLVPGAPIYWDWSGFYVGGQLGMTSSNFNPDNATSSMVETVLRGTTIENEAGISNLPRLPKVSPSGTNYGGFIGFNQQWEDIILSIEASYNAASLSARSSDSIGRSFTASDGLRYNVDLDSQASVALKDYGTVRARAGYVMGRFLPYAQIGGVIGRADISRSAVIDLSWVDADPDNPPDNPPGRLVRSVSESKKNAFIYGVTTGVGLDVAVTPNIFLRGEYEYIHFFQFKGMTLDLHTGRIGAALKF